MGSARDLEFRLLVGSMVCGLGLLFDTDPERMCGLRLLIKKRTHVGAVMLWGWQRKGIAFSGIENHRWKSVLFMGVVRICESILGRRPEQYKTEQDQC
jgi:hypothetical protein